MLFMDVMVMTTMGIDCVWSFLEVEGGEAEAVVVVVVAAEEEEERDPQGEGMGPHPDAPRTGSLCQVSGVFRSEGCVLPNFKCIVVCMNLVTLYFPPSFHC